jgi:hypothetical protein
MSYLPPYAVNKTVIPEAYGIDLQTIVRMIRERWEKFFPKLDYYSLQVAPTAPASANMDKIVGAADNTQFDPLWGEAVDPALRGESWTQPHLSGEYAADKDATDVYATAVPMPSRFRREVKDSELHQWGFDRVRDVVVTIPVVFFDLADLTAKAGDKLSWNSSFYDVVQQTTDGYWRNSNIPLYVILNCQTRRRGS